MTTLFISDLHLDPTRPAITRAFLNLLSDKAKQADALYILGDFFEVWIGDDDDTELNQTIIDALHQLTTSGTPVYIMHGNRDFLIGQQFCQKTGCQMLEDPSVVNLYGEQALLMHGDSLCTDDIEYMQFRQLSRSAQWQQALLSRTVEERRQLATQMRAESKQANSNKAEDIMDVNAGEVIDALEHHQVKLLIHGHTHRPAIHSLNMGQNTAQRVVLGDWDQFGWLLSYKNDNRFELLKFPIE